MSSRASARDAGAISRSCNCHTVCESECHSAATAMQIVATVRCQLIRAARRWLAAPPAQRCCMPPGCTTTVCVWLPPGCGPVSHEKKNNLVQLREINWNLKLEIGFVFFTVLFSRAAFHAHFSTTLAWAFNVCKFWKNQTVERQQLSRAKGRGKAGYGAVQSRGNSGQKNFLICIS